MLFAVVGQDYRCVPEVVSSHHLAPPHARQQKEDKLCQCFEAGFSLVGLYS